MDNKKTLIILTIVFMSFISVWGQKPYRQGTTSGNFLEIGYGSVGNSMGDAYVSAVKDVSAIYWNPAGLGYMEKNEFQFMAQPWLVDISTSFMGLGFVTPNYGNFALGLVYVGYGEEEVTNMESQEGTGETFNGSDLAVSISYGNRIVQWFSFGATMKYVKSKIWHESASAAAFDLGVIVNTSFLSPTGEKKDGLNIGMSISNYGTKMQYDGIDLKQSVDIAPDENGNYSHIPVRYELQSWELPLIFRLGVSFHPIVINNHSVTIAIDALHPNNNSECVNIGSSYDCIIPTFGVLSLRLGYKALFQNDSEYGLSFGAGAKIFTLGNNSVNIDYAYRDIGVLGGTHSYTFRILF